jgi:hypothetical protein
LFSTNETKHRRQTNKWAKLQRIKNETKRSKKLKWNK